MEVKPGYKQTEVGVIPGDWDIPILSELCLFENGDRSSNYPSGSDFTISGVPFINAGHVAQGKIDLASMDYIRPESFARLTRGKVKESDILYCLRGSLGKYGIVPKVFGDGAIASSLVIVRTRPSKIDVNYLVCYFGSDICSQMIAVWSGGAAQPNLGVQDLTRFNIPLPPTITEQKKIAEALSDADALIESLEQLIAKKCQIKQGAMQELLTGKKRLPGFHGAWEVKRLDSIAEIFSGGTPSTNQPEFWEGGIPWCTPTDITALNGTKYLGQTTRAITEQGLKASAAALLPANSIVMTSRATIGECAINTMPVATNQGFKNFVPFPETDGEFLYYLLQTKKQEFIGLCSGSTFLEIGKTQLTSFEVELPRERTEQTAIANILSDMDSELAALEIQLAKARQIKQGMMQELLTGRLRLVPPTVAA